MELATLLATLRARLRPTLRPTLRADRGVLGCQSSALNANFPDADAYLVAISRHQAVKVWRVCTNRPPKPGPVGADNTPSTRPTGLVTRSSTSLWLLRPIPPVGDELWAALWHAGFKVID
jgi:hypothetical protein